VRIEARAKGWDSDAVAFELEEYDRDVSLKGELDFWRPPFFVDADVTVRAWVPHDYSVDVRTGRGSVDVSALRGSVDVQASHGDVQLREVVGDASLETSRGKIEVRSLVGRLDASTSRAIIEVEDVLGPVDLKTNRAPIEVTDVRGELRVRTNRAPIRITASGGPITAETSRAAIEVRDAVGPVHARTNRAPIFASFEKDPEGELHTNRASIEVVLPHETGVDLDARTSRGRVEIDDDFDVEADEADAPVESVDVRLNGGGRSLRLRTNRSDIRVRAR
jgi:DUF4097 and DUF4098 domain-containing protein YvlB